MLKQQQLIQSRTQVRLLAKYFPIWKRNTLQHQSKRFQMDYADLMYQEYNFKSFFANWKAQWQDKQRQRVLLEQAQALNHTRLLKLGYRCYKSKFEQRKSEKQRFASSVSWHRRTTLIRGWSKWHDLFSLYQALNLKLYKLENRCYQREIKSVFLMWCQKAQESKNNANKVHHLVEKRHIYQKVLCINGSVLSLINSRSSY